MTCVRAWPRGVPRAAARSGGLLQRRPGSASDGPPANAKILLRGGNRSRTRWIHRELARSNRRRILRDLCEGLTTARQGRGHRTGRRERLDRQRGRQDVHVPPAPEARWSNGDRVVAADFVAGLRRLVDPDDRVPVRAESSTSIANASDIIAGKKPPDTLGVTAPDDATVVVDLAAPAPYLPALLSHTRAPARCIARRSRSIRTRSRSPASWSRTAPSC